MKNRNPKLTYLITKQYALILLRLARQKIITGQYASKRLGAFMNEIGLPRHVIVLAIWAYISLL
jgi:hypothetical protein